jgi:uncharacterized protein YoxC
MKDSNNIEKKLDYWVKKSLSSVLIVLACLAMTMTAFKTKPDLENTILSLTSKVKFLTTEIKSLKGRCSDLIHHNNRLKLENIQLQRDTLALRNTVRPEIKALPKPIIKNVKEPLSSLDSLVIAEALYDSIYKKRVQEAMKNMGKIHVK